MTQHAGMQIPEPEGNGKKSILNIAYVRKIVRVLNAFLRLKIRRGAKNQLILSDNNLILELIGLDESGSGGSTVPRLRIHEIFGDYLICHTWDGTTEGTEPVYVAKPYLLRQSITTRTVNGVVINYDYIQSWNRTATGDNGEVETQYVTPPWSTGDEIWVDTSDTGVVIPATVVLGEPVPEIVVTYQERDERAWAAF